MPKKNYSKTGSTCRVNFKLQAENEAQSVHLCGDFNNWDTSSHPMKQLKDGSFSLTISLEPGQEYRYRYLADDKRWENDWNADAYLPNQFGTEDSIVRV
jgi:1,4-alpha-glucan branching enzyme